MTGASGFIGSHLIAALAKAHGPAAVTALVHAELSTAESESAARIRALGVGVVECDLLRLPGAQPERPAFDVLYHLAGHAVTENPQGGFAVNSEGTRNLLDWLGPALSGKRVIYTGTLASVDKCDARGPIREDTPCRPVTPYGQTKFEGEKLVQGRAAHWSYAFTILRLCTIVGPGFRPGGMFGVFPKMLRQHALATRLNWPGRVSFLHVADLVEMLLAIPALSQTSNEIYVTSNGDELTFDALLEQMASVLRVERKRLELPDWLWRGLGAVAWRTASLDATPYHSRIFCWRVSHLIRDGLYADASRLNSLLGRRLRTTQDALREIYGQQH
ncbi:MAG TPA: NAD(P)-dependent oxidoreductase [Verrucomicrobiae bacterium]